MLKRHETPTLCIREGYWSWQDTCVALKPRDRRPIHPTEGQNMGCGCDQTHLTSAALPLVGQALFHPASHCSSSGSWKNKLDKILFGARVPSYLSLSAPPLQTPRLRAACLLPVLRYVREKPPNITYPNL